MKKRQEQYSYNKKNDVKKKYTEKRNGPEPNQYTQGRNYKTGRMN